MGATLTWAHTAILPAVHTTHTFLQVWPWLAASQLGRSPLQHVAAFRRYPLLDSCALAVEYALGTTQAAVEPVDVFLAAHGETNKPQ
eukprot:1574594-Amphidinium_carterae.2